MNKLMSSVLRGIGKKRKRYDDTEGGGSSSDDKEWDPDDEFEDEDAEEAKPKKRSRTVKTVKTAEKKPGKIEKKRNTKETEKKKGTEETEKAQKKKKKEAQKALGTRVKATRAKKEAIQESADPLASNALGLLNLSTDALLRVVEILTAEQGILTTVAALSPVCRRLHEFVAALPSYLWRSANLSALSRKISLPSLHSVVLPKFPGLVSLNLEGWPALRDKDLEEICSVYGQTLSEVFLSGSQHLSAKCVTSLSDGCRHLRVVSLSRMSHRVGKGQAVSQLVRRHAGSLESLTLDTLQGEIVGFGLLLSQLTSSGDRLSRLRCLRLANLRSSSHRDAKINLSGLSECAPALESLELVNLGLSAGLEFLPPVEFARLRHLVVQELQSPCRLVLSPRSLPSLASLAIVAADFELPVGDDSVEAADSGVHFPGLSQLTVSHCPNVERQSLVVLLRSVDTLTDVDFTCCGGDLDLNSVRPSSLYGVQTRQPCVQALGRLRQLRRLNLTGSNVSLSAAREIAARLSLLEQFNLTACKCLPRGFKQLLASRNDVAAWLAREAPSDSDG